MILETVQGNKPPVRILLLEDRDTDADLVEYTLKKSGLAFETLRASGEGEFREMLLQGPDIIVTDDQLLLLSAPEALRITQEVAPGIPFIIITGAVTEETAADTTGRGAAGYVMKGDLTHLHQAITDALLKKRVSIEKSDAETRYGWSETQYRTIFNTIQTGILIIDPVDHRIVDINPALATLIGRQRDQIIGHGCHAFICPSEAGKCPITDLHQAIDTSECFLLTSTGTRIPIHKVVAPLVYGEKEYLVESILDITEQKKTQVRMGELLESCNNAIFSLEKDIAGLLMEKDRVIQEKERYRDLTAGLSGIFLSLSPSGSITCARSMSGEIYGYRESDLLGMQFEALVPQDDREDVARFLLRARSGDMKPHDIRFTCRDGSVRPGRMTVRPMYENGDLRGLAILLADLAEWIQATESLHLYQKTLSALFENIPVPLMEIGHSMPGYQKNGTVPGITEEIRAKNFPPGARMIRMNPSMDELIRHTSLLQPARFLDDPAMGDPVRDISLSFHDGATRTGTISIPAGDGADKPADYIVIPGGSMTYLSIIPYRGDDSRGNAGDHQMVQQIFELLPMAAVICASSGIITVANSAASRLLGYPGTSDLAGIPIVDAVGAFDRQRLTEQVWECFGGSGRTAEYLCLRRDGSQFPASLDTRPISHDGTINSCIVHIYPMTL